MNDSEIKAWQYEKLAESLIKKLEARAFGAYYASGADEAKKKVLSLIPEKGLIGIPGSQTMEQIGVFKAVRESGRELVDPSGPAGAGLGPEEAVAYRKKMMITDVLLCGANAMDEEGRLYNIDGFGNRVAATICGPDKVIMAVGMNKVARNPEEAWHRARQVASPLNNKRLSRPNPCVETGRCLDCQKESRICNYFAVIERSRPEKRIEVVLIGGEFGY